MIKRNKAEFLKKDSYLFMNIPIDTKGIPKNKKLVYIQPLGTIKWNK